MSEPRLPEQGSNGRFVLRILRLQPGEEITIRLLSPNYTGTFTHHTASGSVICEGPDCHPSHHKLERLWKGYAAVEGYHQAVKLWIGYVIELTSNMELDFRGKWQRGQCWQLLKARQQTKRRPPTVCVYKGVDSAANFPEPFDFEPTLRRVFKTSFLYLGAENPIPPRAYLDATPLPDQKSDSPPDNPTGKKSKEESNQEVRELIAKAKQRWKEPSES